MKCFMPFSSDPVVTSRLSSRLRSSRVSPRSSCFNTDHQENRWSSDRITGASRALPVTKYHEVSLLFQWGSKKWHDHVTMSWIPAYGPGQHNSTAPALEIPTAASLPLSCVDFLIFLVHRSQSVLSTSMPTVSVWQMTIKVKLEIPWICKWQKYAKIKIKKVERIITFYPMFLGNTVRTRTSKPPPSWTRKLAPPQQQLLWCPSSEWKHFWFSRLSRWTLWSQLTTLCLSQINA